jgi:serine/arginine repetitive matrix protein 2
MYNGIGLTTPRGTGTNGYVTKNLSFVRVVKEKTEYKPEDIKTEEAKKLELIINRRGNAEILAHERKRKIELKCMEMRELMGDEGYSEQEIDHKVEKFRKMLLDKSEKEHDDGLEYDKNGRPIAKESHQMAEVNEIKNKKLREAFGIGEFDPHEMAKKREEEKRAEIEKAKSLNQRKYG